LKDFHGTIPWNYEERDKERERERERERWGSGQRFSDESMMAQGIRLECQVHITIHFRSYLSFIRLHLPFDDGMLFRRRVLTIAASTFDLDMSMMSQHYDGRSIFPLLSFALTIIISSTTFTPNTTHHIHIVLR
jgi:hypothetical protein